MLPSSANPNQWYEEISLREVRHNRLRQDKDFHYIYDNFGNRLQSLPAPYNNESFPSAQPVNSGNRHEYRYDAQQRLVAFWDHYYGRNKCVEYLYDAFGRRLAKINPRKDMPNDADVIFYGWDGDKLVTTQYNQEKIYTLYEPNSFVPLLRLTQPLNADTKTFPNTIHTYYCDHRGAPTALISKEGKIEWQAEYDVWGARLNYSKPDTLYQPIRLQGQHYDVESGLYYNRHRYYDPKIGRYINQDPIGLQGGSHLYNYPLNPNQFVDPLGLVIEYANHEVAFGWSHSKIVITPNNQEAYKDNPLFKDNVDANGRVYATIGAGPTGVPVWGLSSLKSGINRRTDVTGDMNNRQIINIGDCEEDGMIKKLFELSENYNNSMVDYYSFPDVSFQQNSNSFISGLGAAAGLNMPTNTGADTPGYKFPVPLTKFTKELKK